RIERQPPVPSRRRRARRQDRLETTDLVLDRLSPARLPIRSPRMIRPARPEDVSTIAQLIRELARYEKLEDRVTLDEADLREHLFGQRPYVEVLIAEDDATKSI